ncbi:MAG: hypothetical protein NVV70_10015 [Cellulomonas sp.]|nr:hypothetical protein [Cellulomonas sp.]MCR6648443.1 hypothetical protein [Cellulomonas sp.]
MQAALDDVAAAQEDLLTRYDEASDLLAASADGLGAAALVCQQLLDAPSGSPATGDVLTLTPGTVAAGERSASTRPAPSRAPSTSSCSCRRVRCSRR